jgi:hypothetical protein
MVNIITIYLLRFHPDHAAISFGYLCASFRFLRNCLQPHFYILPAGFLEIGVAISIRFFMMMGDFGCGQKEN